MKKILLFLVLASTLSAQTYMGTGTINTGWGAISAGSSFTIQFTLDATVPDTAALPNLGYYKGAARNIVFDCGNGEYVGTAAALNVSILVVDRCHLFSIKTPAIGEVDFPPQGGLEFLDSVGNSVLQFTDYTKSSLLSPDLADVSMATFDSFVRNSQVRFFSLPFRDGWVNQFPVTGTINAVNDVPVSTAIPEPSTYGLIGGGVLILIASIRHLRSRR